MRGSFIRPGVLAAVVAAGAAACDEGAGPQDALAECLAEAGVTGPAVGIRGFEFSPKTLRVEPGATVTWVNCEDPGIDPHTSTSDEGLWDSGFLYPGDRYARTLDVAGDFPYHCAPHPFMEGVVIVETEA